MLRAFCLLACGAPGGARWFRAAGTEAPVGQFPTLSYCCHGLVVDQQEIGLVGAAQKPPFFSVALAPLTLLQSLPNVGRRRSVHDPYRANLETCLEGGKHLLLTRAMYPDMHRSFCFFFLPS